MPLLREAIVVVFDLSQANAAGEDVLISWGLFTVDEMHVTITESFLGENAYQS